MPTYTWTRTKEQARDMVLRRLGILGSQDVATAEDAAVVDEAMNARLKELNALRIMWWNVAGAQTTIAITSGDVDFVVSATDYLYPVSAAIVVGTEQEPLTIIGHREYQAIPNKAEQGNPTSVFFAGTTGYLWPVPNTSTSLKLTYQAIAADIATGEVPDVPVGGLRAIVDIVVADLAPEFGKSAAQQQVFMQRQAEAIKVLRMLSHQRVDSVTVTADYF